MFKKRIKKSRATWLGLLLRKGNSRSKLRKNHSERGIAIPLVIGIGLLMMLLSITVIVRSQSSQINTSNLNQAATAGEVAETGVTRIQSLFASNRTLPLITLYDIVGTTSNSWVEASKTGAKTCFTDGDIVALKSFNNKAWMDIEAGKRQYRVFSYDYFPSKPSTQLTFNEITITTASAIALSTLTSNTYISSGGSTTGQIAGVIGTLRNPSTGTNYTFTPEAAPTTSVKGIIFYPTTDTGIGRLQVEGRIINGTVTSGKTDIVNQVVATSAIQVEIPITPGDIINVPIPGTWLASNFTESGQTFEANVLVPCGVDETTVKLPNPNPKGYTAQKTTLKLPDVPLAPDTAFTVSKTVTTGNKTTTSFDIDDTYALPNNSGYNPGTGSYDYIVQKIDLNGNTNLTINPNYKVNLYVTGDISVGGNGNIIHSKTAGTPALNSTAPAVSDTITTAITSFPATIALNTPTYLDVGSSVVGTLSNGNTGIPGTLLRNSGTNSYIFTPLTAPPTGTINLLTGSIFTSGRTTSSYSPLDLKIYASGTAIGATPSICLNGNASLDAFILAPKYSFGMNGGGKGSAFTGSVWANGYPGPSGCGSSSKKTIVTQNATWDDIGLSPQNLPPSIGATQTWNKKVTNP